MDKSGFKSFAPKVIGFSGALDQLVYVAVSDMGIQVFLKPSSLGEDTFTYKKRVNLPESFSEELIINFLDFYFEECSASRKFYHIEFWPNTPVEIESIFCALIEVVNHSEDHSPESETLLPSLLKWTEHVDVPIDQFVIITSFLGGVRIFTGEGITDHFRERLPRGFEMVLMYSTKRLNKHFFYPQNIGNSNNRKVAAFLRGLFYGDIDFLQRGMEINAIDEFSDQNEVESFFFRTATKCEYLGVGTTSDAHFLYSIFPNSLKAENFHKELRAFKGKNRYLKIYRTGFDDDGAVVK